jgi:predicted nucleotidyltransferase
MTKQELKDKMGEAIRQVPHLADIRSVAIFGSHVNGAPTEESDVDVLIDFEPNATIGFFALSDIKDSLEAVLGKPIDLLTPQAISKYFRNRVLAQAEYVYTKG